MEKNHITLNINYKSEYFKFIILTSNDKLDKNNVISFFDGLLDNLLCLDINNGYLLIYNNKNYITLKDYYDSIRFDIGSNLKIFEGFKIKNNIDNLNIIIDLYYKYLDLLDDDYYTIRDIILKCNDYYELNNIKNILLDKYKDDQYFKNFALGLFDNDLNVSKASQALYMHRNTINNKLESICNDTSLKLQKFNDAVALFKLLNLKNRE